MVEYSVYTFRYATKTILMIWKVYGQDVNDSNWYWSVDVHAFNFIYIVYLDTGPVFLDLRQRRKPFMFGKFIRDLYVIVENTTCGLSDPQYKASLSGIRLVFRSVSGEGFLKRTLFSYECNMYWKLIVFWSYR